MTSERSDGPGAPAPHELDLLDRQVDRYQELVRRQASNSVRVKTWGVTLVAAVAALAANNGKPELLLTALGAVLVFALLDAYYLSLERHFRSASDALVDSYERGKLERKQFFKLESPPSKTRGRGKALAAACWSWAILPFYGIIAFLLLIGVVAGVVTS